MRESIAFYEALGFARKFRATGEAVAFFDTGATVIGLFPWDQLAQDATCRNSRGRKAFRGMTLAWNCNSQRGSRCGDGVRHLEGRETGEGRRKRPIMAAIAAISPIPTAIPGRPWLRPNIEVGDDRRVHLPD